MRYGFRKDVAYMMVIEENLYQAKSQISMRNFFFTAMNDEEAIEFIYKNHKFDAITLNRIFLDGSRPKVSLYTSKKWKQLCKEDK